MATTLWGWQTTMPVRKMKRHRRQNKELLLFCLAGQCLSVCTVAVELITRPNTLPEKDSRISRQITSLFVGPWEVPVAGVLGRFHEQHAASEIVEGPIPDC